MSKDHSARPLEVGIPKATAIAAGETSVLALTESGEPYFWGTLRPISDPRSYHVHEPFRVSISGVTRISAGAALSCAWGQNRVLCWGPDLYWLGIQTKDPFEPTELDWPRKLDPFAIGRGVNCGIDPRHTVRCSGETQSLGAGRERSYTRGWDRDVVVEGLSDARDLSSRWQTCVVVADGRVACWGLDQFTDLGDGEPRTQPRPAWIPGVSGAERVAIGESDICVLTREGRVFCWGENGYGQLGDGTADSRVDPAEVQFCAATPKPVFPDPPADQPLIAAMQRDVCYGSCPVYTVRVYGDGTVAYHGDWHVRVRGGRTRKLGPSEIEALLAAFRRADFLTFDYRCRDAVTDADSVRVFYSDGRRARLINHYHGCKGPPPALNELEDDIDRIVGTRDWVGHPHRGPAELGAFEGPLTIPGIKEEPN